MKKILFIGDANHQFIIALVKWIKKTSPNIQVDIFNTKSVFNSQYVSIFDNIYQSSKKNSYILKIRYLNSIYNKFTSLYDFNKIKKKYDYVHIHMASSISYNIRKKLKYKGKKIIITVWGSDFYRANIKFKTKLFDLFSRADIITFANPMTLKDFSSFYCISDNKLVIKRFGLEPLDILKSTITDKKISKKQLNLPHDKLIITIGYNAAPEQQHQKILNVISNSDYIEKIKERCFFIFPLTYAKRNGYEKYKTLIEQLLERNGYDYRFYESFLTDSEVAHLRNSSDIMIQLQLTDQFSGSMQEYLYSENLIITGEWLPYEFFENNNVYFRKIDSINDLGVVLFSLIKNLEKEKLRTKGNKNRIYELSSWCNNINDWLKLYN